MTHVERVKTGDVPHDEIPDKRLRIENHRATEEDYNESSKDAKRVKCSGRLYHEPEDSPYLDNLTSKDIL